MSTQDVFVQQFAKLFVHYQESLGSADESAIPTSQESWQDAPLPERERTIAAARLALMELESKAADDSRRWYARPGQAEWGC